MKRFVVVVFALGVIAARPAHTVRHELHSEIGIVINGVALPLEPPPHLDRGVLLVPVRRTIVSLGFDFESHASRMTTHVGSKTVTLIDGSRIALVDGTPIALDAPAERIDGVFYAPLRFFTSVLGAQAVFDRQARTVTIVAQLVGRSGAGDFTQGDRTVRVGTVTAVDTNSDPPTVTLAFNASVRTIAISNNAIVTMRDVGVNVDAPGELSDIRPGDYAQIVTERDGRVSSVVDEYGSRYGVIAVADTNELLMQDGHVIVPDRDTEISLNGQAASMSDLQAGDRASIRYNVETGEIREIVAQRTLAPLVAQSGSASIASVGIDAGHPLRAGETLTVTMTGSAGGAATFDIGPYVANVAMVQRSAGTYVGSYDIGREENFTDAPIVASLRMPDGSTVSARAAQTLSASTEAPGIATIGPADGSVVNLDAPAIYATFVTQAVPVNPSSVTLEVDGRDVSAECLRTPHFVQYLAQTAYRRGPIRVTVRVSDEAGNTATRTWTFTIR
ncbi:MAG: copper amine oxidase N-terminal domain-containing protein [Candidatus Tyrphobacter sp.]